MIKSILFVCLVLLISCGDKKDENKKTAAPPVSVKAIILSKVAADHTVAANGSISADQYVELHPEVSGRLVYLNIPEGQTVQAGTLLAELFNEDLKATQKKNESDLSLALLNKDRLGKLLNIGGTDQASYDAAVSQVNALQAEVDLTKAQIRKTQIMAPFDGVMGLRKVSVGAYVAPTDMISSIQELQNLKVDFTVPQDLASHLHNGDIVQVQASEDTTSLEARIVAINPALDADTRNIAARAAFLKPCNIPAGSFVKVIVHSDQKESIFIPSSAVIPDSRGDLVVLVKGGKARFTLVQLGVRKNDVVEVNQGLQAGDTLAVTGILFLRKDGPVKIESIDPGH